MSSVGILGAARRPEGGGRSDESWSDLDLPGWQEFAGARDRFFAGLRRTRSARARRGRGGAVGESPVEVSPPRASEPRASRSPRLSGTGCGPAGRRAGGRRHTARPVRPNEAAPSLLRRGRSASASSRRERMPSLRYELLRCTSTVFGVT